jgi:cytochrome c-type biogenesis protein CcmH
MRRLALMLLFLLAAFPVPAVEPSEMLADPTLEARAREISRVLRCPVCQSENIDDSGAPVAADLRRLVRERIMAGDSDQQVIDYVVARYGEFVLFDPAAKGVNLILWTAGPAMLVLGLGIAALAWRRRRGGPAGAAEAPLSEDERARLEEILKS